MSRTIALKKNLLEKNDAIAARLRDSFAKRGCAVVNIMSSPGAGKTSLLARTIERLKGQISIGVIVGDLATDHDAQIIENAGAEWTIQINTGGGCHLDASMIEQAMIEAPDGLDLVIIENVGNLVCPAGYDLGQDVKVMLSALTEGSDKPKKYPTMYRACTHLVINKIDLESALELSAVDFEKEALQVNPALKVFHTSAKTGAGLDSWCEWLKSVVHG